MQKMIGCGGNAMTLISCLGVTGSRLKTFLHNTYCLGYCNGDDLESFFTHRVRKLLKSLKFYKTFGHDCKRL